MQLVKSCSAVAGICTVILLLLSKSKLNTDKVNVYPVDDEAVNDYMVSMKLSGYSERTRKETALSALKGMLFGGWLHWHSIFEN